MYFEIGFDRYIKLEENELNYFFNELPYICNYIINQGKRNTDESLFDIFSKKINIDRHQHFQIWLRKYSLFLLRLLYINKYKLIEVKPLKIEKI